METCERCGAEALLDDSGFLHCESCGWAESVPSYCYECGAEITPESAPWDDGLCARCADFLDQAQLRRAG